MKKARNAFEAQPSSYRGAPTRGVATHPGFHTASEMIISQPYAQMKISNEIPTDWSEEELSKPIHDYPVIVELDMHGLPFVPDWDAMTWFQDAVDAMLEHCEDYDDFDSWVESPEEGEEMPDTVVEGLFHLTNQTPGMALYLLRDWILEQEDHEAAFQKIKKEGVPDELLAKSARQFRYLKDVPTGRIIAVHYIKPVFDHLFPSWDSLEYEERGYNKITDRIEAAGYDTINESHVLEGMEVLDIVESVDLRPQLWEAPDRRIEYHGTSLRNLLSAAPHLKDQLPTPPAPFKWEAEEDE
jgi:hypothetical protein